uniref:NBS-LRR class RGA n=2 Tax=Oryza sativa subsp. japonica TaxID=39947 RepID=Q5VN00_ORYSJ|nr:disease resistance protein RGA2 [Oryza sativa Japonica Group]BAD69173.1 putative NBS-LRR class RGA [Oryza sativa Japonica Group]
MVEPVTASAAVGWGISAVGWVVSPIITKLLGEGFSFLGFETKEKLKELETKVLELQMLREVVEESPHRARLMKWSEELKSALYDAEDIFDDVEYNRLERRILSESDDMQESDFRARPALSCVKGKQVCGTSSDHHGMSKSKLKKILGNIEKIINEGHDILKLLDLKKAVATNSRAAVTTSAPPNVVFGRDEDRNKVIAMLHDRSGDEQPNSSSALNYSVIGIYGIAGSGKSTLAQYVIAHEKELRREKSPGHFDLIMWVHVSQKFSVNAIFTEMLDAATERGGHQFSNLDTLQQKLEEELNGKKILLVLDDVWYHDSVSQLQLEKIVSPLNVGSAGSKILVTSRSKDALVALGAVRRIPISELNDSVFLELFMHSALSGANIDERDRNVFAEIGRGIANKLRKSPLAAKLVGGQLRMRPDVDFWRDAGNRDLLKDTRGALWWSYQHLDEQVRRCFAYCSIFPRRHRLKREELIKLWVAEGFIETTGEGGEEEALAGKYFEQLVSSSFLQPGVNQEGVFHSFEYFTIHDLLHDIAEEVSRSDCFRVEDGWKGVIPPNVRHISIETYSRAIIQKVLEMENLRTLIIYSVKTEMLIEEKEFEDMFTRLRKLRVLHLVTATTSNTFSFPASIEKLKHLRYLSLQTGEAVKLHLSSQTDESVKLILPGTFTKLYHMQVLDFIGNTDLVFSAGKEMSNLINLRHLISFTSMNFPNIGRLTLLQTLKFFTVKKEPGYELQQLKHLKNLQGKLQIDGLQNVHSKNEAVEANLAGKECLKELSLFWEDESSNPNEQEEVIEGLQPPMGLQNLEIFRYQGSRYPSWMVDKQTGLKNLRVLALSNCRQLKPAPELFELLVHLQSFSLCGCSWDTLPDNMEQLMSLQNLMIYLCTNLLSLPTLPRSLAHLVIGNCDPWFTRSCQTIAHENWQKVQHIPNKEIFCDGALFAILRQRNH